MLQWARANGCPWNKWTCMYAAQGGYLEVLQWLRANGCPWNRIFCAWMAKDNDHQVVVAWLNEK